MEKHYNREYKATLFSLIFGENKENLLDLFNALNGTSYGNAEEIEYTTLESDRGFFLRLKNDIRYLTNCQNDVTAKTTALQAAQEEAAAAAEAANIPD